MVYSKNSLGKQFFDIALSIGGGTTERMMKFNSVGVFFHESLTWEKHIKLIHSKASSRV